MRRSGFTLIEITLAVAILAVMSLAIYRFVQTNMVAIRASTDASASDARYGGLHDLLTAQWQSLAPGSGALMGEPFKLDDRSRDEITWICGAGPGLLTRYASTDFVVTLRLQRHSDKGDQFDLGLLRKPKKESDSPIENQSWIPLIDNVQSVQIRYFDPRINSWVDRWTDAMTLPRLVKLTIGRSDGAVPWEGIIPLARTSF
ncbi:MAG TPA: prepilin-type N-terminal cleavage/methylation domain-containing protein [Chthoniobacterales bacterium]|nr:prepilin-type N-terminal cleavage/methylation domain-containing protein [Chthoniobacterales bacterium]